MSEPDRAALMAARLARTARRAGVDEDGVARLARAFDAAMAPRRAAGIDDHHPAYLHPGRTAIILLDDLGASDAAQLAASALCETIDVVWRAPVDGQPAGVQALVGAVPVPAHAGDQLLELLLASSPAVQAIALAERLDHARHLHLRPEQAAAALHRETREAYLPVARQAHPVLARRLAWWCDTFERRFL